MNITVTVTSRNSSNWLKLAQKLAKAECDKQGIAWVDAEITVVLPEYGRFFTKQPGYISLGSIG